MTGDFLACLDCNALLTDCTCGDRRARSDLETLYRDDAEMRHGVVVTIDEAGEWHHGPLYRFWGMSDELMRVHGMID